MKFIVHGDKDWCEKHHRALFVKTCHKDLFVTTRILHQVFSCYGEVLHIARFRGKDDFDAPVNFYDPEDAIDAFCELQGRRIYEGCCELVLYFASEIVCGHRPYIPWYMLEQRPTKNPLISWQLPTEKYRDLAPKFSQEAIQSSNFSKEPIRWLNEPHPTRLEPHDAETDIGNNKGDTFEEDSIKEVVQVANSHEENSSNIINLENADGASTGNDDGMMHD